MFCQIFPHLHRASARRAAITCCRRFGSEKAPTLRIGALKKAGAGQVEYHHDGVSGKQGMTGIAETVPPVCVVQKRPGRRGQRVDEHIVLDRNSCPVGMSFRRVPRVRAVSTARLNSLTAIRN